MTIAATREQPHPTDQIRRLMDQLWHWHFGEFCPAESWTPPVNVYRLERGLEVCVDIAGVQRDSLDVRVEPGRLVIRGNRAAPEPQRSEHEPMRIVSMEIDHGPFCRTVALPENIDLRRVTSDYENGLLWIRMPMRVPG